MPKSRRVKVVPLSKVKPKDRQHKEDLMHKIKAAIEEFPSVYTFTVDNLRTNLLQKIRDERREDTRIFLGNNKVMQLALGRDAESSAAPNLYKLSRMLTGLSGLMFTKLSKKEVKEYFGGVGGAVFARAGTTATVPFTIPAGPLPNFQHSIFDHLQKLGLPVKLDKGVIIVTNETRVCSVGDELSAQAAQVLKLFGVASADFNIKLTGHWEDNVARKIADKA